MTIYTLRSITFICSLSSILVERGVKFSVKLPKILGKKTVQSNHVIIVKDNAEVLFLNIIDNKKVNEIRIK